MQSLQVESEVKNVVLKTIARTFMSIVCLANNLLAAQIDARMFHEQVLIYLLTN